MALLKQWVSQRPWLAAGLAGAAGGVAVHAPAPRTAAGSERSPRVASIAVELLDVPSVSCIPPCVPPVG